MKKPDHKRLRLGRLPVDRVTFDEALDSISVMVEQRRGGVVLTPNVDHVVLAETDAGLRAAYAAADLSLADGMPVVWASHLLGLPVPEKISGSDLAPRLMQLSAARGWRVFLMGGDEGVAARAADNLLAQHPLIRIAGVSSARIDLREPPSKRQSLVDEIRTAAPDIVLVGLGAPKQELWIHEVAKALCPAVLLGVGASIGFIAGTSRRAPAWVSASGLEWFYRLALEPRRLSHRYLVRDPRFLGILLQDLRARRAPAGAVDGIRG